jgi:regulation of enolase protein 1 (concanavalin A-like superfamily)
MNPTVLRSISQPGNYVVTAMARTPDDQVVNIGSTKVKVNIKDFQGLVDFFEVPSFKKNWLFMKGVHTEDEEARIERGELTLSSKSGNFNAHANDNGVLLYKELMGDFVMECMVTGMTGSEKRQTPAYNEGGLMVLDDSDKNDQQIVQMGVFPNYNCGNMLTTVSNHGRRPQFPCGNGWDYAPYMQIERQGTTFYVRVSDNGMDWRETVGSPVVMPQMTANKALKVGIYQVTYTDNKASVSFDNFKLYVKKQE